MKIPDPIIDPATIAVALNRPRLWDRLWTGEETALDALLVDTCKFSTGKYRLAPYLSLNQGLNFPLKGAS
jgi:hypothetical protein